MRYAFLAAILMVGGIAVRIVAARHRPMTTGDLLGAAAGWSPTAYDLGRIGGWGLLIIGLIILAVALVREIKR